MRVMAQMGMVMNLDKCIGCHTCSVTCKQAWTNRAGTEYVWFNNVETRPGQGYPRRHEDQEQWKGGWELNKRGRLQLKTGGRLKRLLSIFASPVQPELDDYYEPWTYDYKTLVEAPLGDDFPVARPKSLITGEDTKVTWSANWDDNLGGASEMGHLDPIVQRVRRESEDKIKFEFEQTFMFYLPRICEHCLNPACMASCPSGRDLQALRGRHRAGRPGPLPRLAPVHHRLPVQEDLLQPQVRQGREVHVLLPPRGGRPPDRLLGDLRRPAALPRAVPVRRRRGHRGRVGARRQGPLRGADGPAPRPRGPRRDRGRAGAGHPRGLAGRRAPIPGLRAGEEVPGRAAAASGVPHDADGLVRPAAVAGRRPAHRAGPRRRGPATSSSAPSRRCGSRSSTSPSSSPPGTPRSSTACCASSPRCAPTCAASTSAASPTPRSPPRSG